MQAPYKQFTAMLRLIAAFNGAAALLLTAFSLGIVGADTASPDLSEPLSYFLAGLGACGLAQVLLFLAQLRRARRMRLSLAPGGHLGLALAILVFAGGVAGFGLGCWSASGIDASDSGQATNTTAVYAGRLPAYTGGKKIAAGRIDASLDRI
ncbi:MAG TPA: hypothetical protein VF445_05410 [Bordetella sp.]|uniref:hypothetical protein n=1 Tax=Bordetella sp. TaxID=28081 RepID=UPI002ED280B1